MSSYVLFISLNYRSCYSMLNPIIYAFTVEDFKTSLKQLFNWSTYRSRNGNEPEFFLPTNEFVPPPTPKTPKISGKSQKSHGLSPSSNFLRTNRRFLDLSQITLASNQDLLLEASMSNGEIQKETVIDELFSSTTDNAQATNDDEEEIVPDATQISAQLYTMLVNSKSTGV